MEPVPNYTMAVRAPDWSLGGVAPPPEVAWAARVQTLGLQAQGLGPAAVSAVGATLRIPIQSPSNAAAAYASGLARGGRRVDARRDPTASRQELVCVAEFCEWLGSLPYEWGRNAHTAVPEDIVAFFEAHWVALHGRTGQAREASASGVKGALLHLEHYFDALGRTGDWRPHSLTGNPCRSPPVRGWLKGYKREQWKDGVRPVAATPMSHEAAQLMVSTAGNSRALAPAAAARPRAPPAPEVVAAVEARDRTMVLYLHETGQRAREGSRLRWCDLNPSPLGWSDDGPPPSVVVSPNGSKTKQQRNCGNFTLWSVARPGAQVRPSEFLSLVPALMRANTAAGFPPRAEGPVFLKTTGAGYRLTGDAATYAVARRIVQQRAAYCGLASEVFTGHSARRGRFQEDQDEGIAPEVTRARFMDVCYATYALYTNRMRPLRRRVDDTPPAPAVAPTPRPAPEVGADGVVSRAWAWLVGA